MTYHPVRLKGLLAKIEASYGVDSVPTTADGVRLADDLWPQLRYSPRWPGDRPNVAGATIWPVKPAAPRGRIVELEIPWELRGAGVDAVVEADPLLRACGWTQADGLSVFTYTLAAQAHESCTIYAYAGNLLWKIVGCRGTLRWPQNPGATGVMIFSMQGRLSAEPATASVPAVTYDTTAPIPGVSLDLTVAPGILDHKPTLITGEFNQGATPAWTDDANGDDGLGEFDWGFADPFLTITARKVALATYDPWADEKAVTSRVIDVVWGSAQFNRLELDLPETYVAAPEPSTSDGFTDYTLRYRVHGDAAAPVITSS